MKPVGGALGRLATGGAAAAFLSGSLLLGADPVRPEVPPIEETVEVRSRGWGIGERREYALVFDAAPFGRQAVRLAKLARTAEDGAVRVFELEGSADLRAAGTDAGVTWEGTLALGLGDGRPVAWRSVERSVPRARYAPDPDAAAKGARGRTFQVEFAAQAASWQIEDAAGSRGTGSAPPGPPSEGVLDLRFPVLWGPIVEDLRVEPGASRRLRVFVAAPTFRFDYHLPSEEPPPLQPAIREIEVRAIRREPVRRGDSVETALRLEAPEIGHTIFVSASGILLRVETAWGLVVELREAARRGR